LVWLKFVLCSVIVVFAGTKAARYADTLAEKTGLGRIWVGLLLLAVMTSMPELITGVSSVALVTDKVTGVRGVPDLGLGTLLGSCIFNITIMAVLDVLSRAGPILSLVSRRQMASAGVGFVFAAILGGAILAGDGWSGVALGWVGIPSMVVFVLYLAAAWGLSRLERSAHVRSVAETGSVAGSIRGVSLKFALAAVAVIGAGIWMSYVGDEIAAVTGWGTSFVGSLLLAITTSLPELVVAITAFRLGAIDMAMADILGANILDMSYVFILDLFYSKGPILSYVSQSHAITAGIIMAMSAAIALGLRFRQRRKTFRVISWYAVLLVGLYLYGAYALFSSGTG